MPPRCRGCKGAFALAFLFAGEDDLLIGARRGSPLAIGHGEGEMYLGSDAIALAPFTNVISYLEDGDFVVAHARRRRRPGRGRQGRDAAGDPLQRLGLLGRQGQSPPFHGQGNLRAARSGGPHARAITSTSRKERIALPTPPPFDFRRIDRLSISACGTAYYAGLIGKYWFERFARLPVEIDVASEFRYREAPFAPGNLALFVSQSGETADTLATLRYARGQRAAHRVDRQCRDLDHRARKRRGDADACRPEMGVASTKAFTCQLMVLACLAIAAGRARGVLSADDEAKLVRALTEMPRHMAEALALEPQIERLARDLAKCRDVLYLGRGTSFPLALEGALKLKEISYIHAEGYAAGELKHGPIALIDETMPVVVIAPYDRVFEKTVSNMQEVAARGGRIILITDPKGAQAAPSGIARHPDGSGHARDRHAARLCGAGATHRLSCRRHHRHRCRPAAQSREVGHGGVTAAATPSQVLNASAIARLLAEHEGGFER